MGFGLLLGSFLFLFFFNRHYLLLGFLLPQRILILLINSETLPITYSVCWVFVELADKLYNPSDSIGDSDASAASSGCQLELTYWT